MFGSVGEMRIGRSRVARCERGATRPVKALGARLRRACGFAISAEQSHRLARTAEALVGELAREPCQRGIIVADAERLFAHDRPRGQRVVELPRDIIGGRLVARGVGLTRVGEQGFEPFLGIGGCRGQIARPREQRARFADAARLAQPRRLVGNIAGVGAGQRRISRFDRRRLHRGIDRAAAHCQPRREDRPPVGRGEGELARGGAGRAQP